MLSDNLNVTALAIYAGSKVVDTTVRDSGRVEFELELSPEAQTLIEQSRRGGLQVDYLRLCAAQEEVRGILRRAKQKASTQNARPSDGPRR